MKESKPESISEREAEHQYPTQYWEQCDVPMRERRVTCLVYDGKLRAGMDCDWAHADGSDNLQEKDY